ncbi:hypothetical protein [Sulfurisoma sediminicola]|uniref:hypothetical protein n=1 Tax=Sulfurisoma sediminicola TaxID=1381557 RepID=UPI000EB02934|nr:hypothetical protein [Sulfurisoma sediminicola]
MLIVEILRSFLGILPFARRGLSLCVLGLCVANGAARGVAIPPGLPALPESAYQPNGTATPRAAAMVADSNGEKSALVKPLRDKAVEQETLFAP